MALRLENGRKYGLELTNGPKDRVILGIYGEVGVDFTADDVRDALSGFQESQHIEARIDSPGGSYFDGIAIHTTLSRYNTHVIVDGEAASAGSLIAMAGKSIHMAEGTWMMIHEVHGTLKSAPAEEFKRAVERMESTNTDMVGIYSKRWTGDEKSLRKAMRDTTWLNAKDSMKFGMSDGMTDGVRLAARAELSKFAYENLPDELKPKQVDIPPHIASAVQRLGLDTLEKAAT